MSSPTSDPLRGFRVRWRGRAVLREPPMTSGWKAVFRDETGRLRLERMQLTMPMPFMETLHHEQRAFHRYDTPLAELTRPVPIIRRRWRAVAWDYFNQVVIYELDTEAEERRAW